MGRRENWALFYRFDGARPTHFREVRYLDSTVWAASGAAMTWGQETRRSLSTPAAARDHFEQECLSAEREGFTPTRRGHYDPERMNWSQLEAEIREGARRAFASVRDVHGTKGVNCYALISDDDAMTICPAANNDPTLREGPGVGNREDYLWNASEWSFDEGDEHLDIAYRMILLVHRGMPCSLDFAEFRAGVFESCIRALEQLDAEGFFGSGAEREGAVVRFQVSDSKELPDAMKRLNPPKTYERYRRWLDSWS